MTYTWSSSSSTSSSSPFTLPLLTLLLLHTGRPAEVSLCKESFRSGPGNFVLDTEDATKEGASLLSTAPVQSAEDCELSCCVNERCNLALLEPRFSGAVVPAGTRTCILFNCIRRNRFVCRFVNQAGFESFIRESTFLKYLAGPRGTGQPIANAGRDVIMQPVGVVTLNGIESLALGDAHITDYRWSLQSGHSHIKMEDTQLPDQVRLSVLQPGSYVFTLNITDSNGQSDDSNVTVLVLSTELTKLYCLAPVKVGPCRAAFPRWHYDAVSGMCALFMFGGCKQNNNNYLSREDCQIACIGVKASVERAASPSTEVCGPECGPAQLTCGSGCCVDTNLECDDIKHCLDGSDEEHCNKLNQTFTRLLSIDVNQRKARCAEPPLTGPCRASHTRWYYDPLDRKCHRFTYGGCQGNENNFEEEDKCDSTCDGVTERHVFSRGVFDRFEKEEKDTDDSGSVALAVVLSVAILALLAILTYCFLKKRREHTHRPVTTSPSHVALPEQDALVYSSTNKPI